MDNSGLYDDGPGFDDLKDIRVEILVEEPSMENFLRTKLPEILPQGYRLSHNVFIRTHNGKSDLLKSVPKKIQAFSQYFQPARIIIIQDQDSNNCKVLKQQILDTCSKAGSCPVLVRIACRELENWYLGDLKAIDQTYPGSKAGAHGAKARYGNPDNCQGTVEMKKLVAGFQKGQASREIPSHMDLSRNNSPSLAHLVNGIKRFLGEP